MYIRLTDSDYHFHQNFKLKKMKYIKSKIIVVILLAVIFSSCEFNNNPATVTKGIVNRFVLVELSTNVNCIHCPPSGHFLDLIDTAVGITSSDTNVIIIRMHSSIFPADPYYYFNVPVNRTREQYYQVVSNPTGYLNGAIMPAFNEQTWGNAINVELAKEETHNIILSNVFDTTARTGTLNLTVSQKSGNPPNDLRLFIAVTESGLYYAGGSNGERWFKNVLRDLLTAVDGDPVSISPGTPFAIAKNYTLKNGIIPKNSEIIVFVQSLSTKQVSAVNKIKLTN